ncbi:hypothetical protein P8452_12981 [Trifolium repens]|nr:hypothetical protein P8452_12981 [Trifolium repens]
MNSTFLPSISSSLNEHLAKTRLEYSEKIFNLRRRVTDLLHLNNFCRKKSSESGGLCRLYNIDSPLHLLLETTSVMIDTRV